MRSVSLPVTIRQQIAKLPSSTQAVVANRLRDARVPILYEDAVKQLVAVRDIDTTKKMYIAADGLAVWGRLHEDNRAIFEAQKLKAHALRQMFMCAKMLGEPHDILRGKVSTAKARRAEELASFEHKGKIDEVGDKITADATHTASGRPELLVGAIADQSPLGQKKEERREELRRKSATEAQAELKRRVEDDPRSQFQANVLGKLRDIVLNLGEIETVCKALTLSRQNKKLVHTELLTIEEMIDRIELMCDA